MGADFGEKCERPGARVEQNLWQEVIRKCSLPPAPPTGGHPKHPRFDNVLGAGEGGWQLRAPGREPGAYNYSPHGPLAPGARPRGPLSAAQIREPGKKKAVELVEPEEGAARAKRGPAVGITATAALGVSRPGPGGHRLSPRAPRSALRSVGALAPASLLFRARRLREPWRERARPRPSRHLPVLPAPHSAELRETLPMAPGPPPVFPPPAPAFRS